MRNRINSALSFVCIVGIVHRGGLTKNRPHFVKIISPKNDNFDLALRKRLFCDAKQPLLPCKTYAFGMQNNRFCNALIVRRLYDSFACEKCLQPYCPFFVQKASGCF